MASQITMNAEAHQIVATEQQLLGQLLGLYDEEHQVYGRVLELSRQQGEMVRNGGNMSDIRQVLEKKKNCLEIIARLEKSGKPNKHAWGQRRMSFSPRSRRTLQESLNRVTKLIEEILTCEEMNDLYLIEQAGA
ncbi:MAG: hypothetical protein ACI9UK_001523 [Candidatus Krumholzibacteriia bacterium]|jgi:hypothetical protein